MEDQLFSSQNSDLNNHLALCIDNNDNQMTFGMLFCVENTPVQFFCYELRGIRKGTSQDRGTGELCGIIIVVSRP